MCQFGPDPDYYQRRYSSIPLHVPLSERSAAAERMADLIKNDTGHAIPAAVIEALIAGPHWERLTVLAHLVHGRRL
jgi:hypothetical protein